MFNSNYIQHPANTVKYLLSHDVLKNCHSKSGLDKGEFVDALDGCENNNIKL